MPTKKTEQPQTETKAARLAGDWNAILKWLFIVGGLLTGVVNALAINPDFAIPDGLIWVFVIIGIVVGVFYFNSDDFINIGLRFMIFTAAARSLPGDSEVIQYITAFLLGFSFYLGPIVLTLAIVYFVKKYLLNR